MAVSISRLTQTVVGGSPHQLDYAALRAAGIVIPEHEVGAAEDYLLDAEDGAVLRDRLSSYLLEQGGLAVAAPVLSDQGAVLDGQYGGLLCRTVDQTEITVAAIYQRPADTIDAALLIIGSDTGTGLTGFGIYTADPGGIYLSIRPGTGDPSINSATADPLIPRGSWAFVCASMSATATTIYLGSAGALVKSSASGVARTLAGQISLGKTLNMGASYGVHDLSIRRGIVWREALTEAQVLAAYQRAQVVCQRRGWALV